MTGIFIRQSPLINFADILVCFIYECKGIGNHNAIIKTGSAYSDEIVIETAFELTKLDGKNILVGVPKQGDNMSMYSLSHNHNGY